MSFQKSKKLNSAADFWRNQLLESSWLLSKNVLARRIILALLLILLLIVIRKTVVNRFSEQNTTAVAEINTIMRADFVLKQKLGAKFNVDCTSPDSKSTNVFCVQFYFFLPTNVSVDHLHGLYNATQFIEYLIEVEEGQPNDHLIALCGVERILNDFYQLYKPAYNYVVACPITEMTYERLSIPKESICFLVVNENNQIIWISLQIPSDSVLSKLFKKFGTERR